MKALSLTTLMVLLAAHAAMADEPAQVAAPTASAVTPAPDSAPAVDPAQQAARAKLDKDKSDREANAIKQLRAQGYKPVKQKNGAVLYCHNEAPLGSRLEQQRCSTLEAMLDSMQKSQEMTEAIRVNGLHVQGRD